MTIKDVRITGLHATYWKALCLTPGNVSESEDSKKHFKVFERYIDVYMLAPVLGVVHNRKTNKNLPASTDSAGMLSAVQNAEYKKLAYIRSLVLLLDPTDEKPVEKIDRVFRYDGTDSAVSDKNDEIYMDYFKGGLEYLYEIFVEPCITEDDYLEKMLEVAKTESIDKMSITEIMKGIEGSGLQ